MVLNNNKFRIYEAQLAVVESFHWIHGRKRILVSDKALDTKIAWINGWLPDYDGEHAVFLQDTGITVSSNYYKWLINALNQSRNNSEIYGIMLNINTKKTGKKFVIGMNF